MPVAPPHGLEQVIATFGDIFAYVGEDHTLDPIWQIDQLATIPLLFPIALSWDRSRQLERRTCHKLLRGRFEAVFLAIHEGGLRSKITSSGGCFSFRPQRNGTELSTHSWGIAIDFNPESNLQGECGEYGPRSRFHLPAIGVHAGGEWQGKARDPMHFQYYTGY